MTMREISIVLGGKSFNALREDQKMRVAAMMMSWRAVTNSAVTDGWYDKYALRRAVKKVLNNYP